MLQSDQESTIIGKVKSIYASIYAVDLSGLNNNQIVNFCKLNQERGSENRKWKKSN